LRLIAMEEDRLIAHVADEERHGRRDRRRIGCERVARKMIAIHYRTPPPERLGAYRRQPLWRTAMMRDVLAGRHGERTSVLLARQLHGDELLCRSFDEPADTRCEAESCQHAPRLLGGELLRHAAHHRAALNSCLVEERVCRGHRQQSARLEAAT